MDNKLTQDPNTPKYDTTSGLLTDYGKSLGLKEINKAIPVASLGSVSPVVLPEKPVSLTGEDITLSSATTPEQETAKLKAQTDTSSTEYKKLLNEMGIVQAKETGYAKELGAEEQQAEYDRLAGDIKLEQLNTRNKIKELKLNPQGMSSVGVASTINDIESKSLSKTTEMAIQAEIAMNRVDRALTWAKKKVESELAPLKAQSEYTKFILENNQDLYTTAQKAKLTSLYNKQEKEVAKEEERLTKGEEMIIDAQVLKAPTSVIEKARKILSTGGTKLDVAQALGKYNRDLDMELKTAQISKAWADAKKADTTSGTLTESQVKQIDLSPQGKKLGVLSGLYQKSQTYKNLVDLHGFKAVGANKALLDSAYADLKIAYKEAANLGALTGPDVLLIEEAIKPSSGAKNYLEYKLSGGQLGVSGAIDKALFKARKEALQNYKQLTARNTEYKGSEYVSSLITPFAKDYSTIDLDTVEAGEIIQTEDGLLLESLGGGNFSPL